MIGLRLRARLRTSDSGEAEPGAESSKRSWIEGTWGRLKESWSNRVKSMYSPRRILSSKFLSRGRWRPRGVAAPCLRGAVVAVLGVAVPKKGSTGRY